MFLALLFPMCYMFIVMKQWRHGKRPRGRSQRAHSIADEALGEEVVFPEEERDRNPHAVGGGSRSLEGGIATLKRHASPGN